MFSHSTVIYVGVGGFYDSLDLDMSDRVSALAVAGLDAFSIFSFLSALLVGLFPLLS